MDARYRHRQTGRLLRLAVLLPVPLLIVAVALTGSTVAMAVCAAVVVLGVLVGTAFSSLTIEIDAGALHWWFGWRLWQKRIALDDITATARVRNPWWYGFGIHRTPRGWLYNVRGLDAVEIRLRDGRTLRLGTDEPEKLRTALAAARTR